MNRCFFLDVKRRAGNRVLCFEWSQILLILSLQYSCSICIIGGRQQLLFTTWATALLLLSQDTRTTCSNKTFFRRIRQSLFIYSKKIQTKTNKDNHNIKKKDTSLLGVFKKLIFERRKSKFPIIIFIIRFLCVSFGCKWSILFILASASSGCRDAYWDALSYQNIPLVSKKFHYVSSRSTAVLNKTQNGNHGVFSRSCCYCTIETWIFVLQ
jgi:hypothetical protein